MTDCTITINSPMGRLSLSESNGLITQCRFGNDPLQREKASPVLRTARRQLEEYFAGRRTEFDLPLAPSGTAFQEKVWAILQTIPYGETWSYRQLARQAGSPKAARAVGSANAQNPICIIIPCHRVIRTTGEPGLYAGGEAAKIKLLELEQKGICIAAA